MVVRKGTITVAATPTQYSTIGQLGRAGCSGVAACSFACCLSSLLKLSERDQAQRALENLRRQRYPDLSTSIPTEPQVFVSEFKLLNNTVRQNREFERNDG
jgi:hypothetical protein